METTQGVSMPGWSTWTAPSAQGGAAYPGIQTGGSTDIFTPVISWIGNVLTQRSTREIAQTTVGIWQGIQQYQLQKDALNQAIKSRNAEIAASVQVAQIAANAQTEAARFQRPMISESGAPMALPTEEGGMSPMWLILIVVVVLAAMR